MELSTTMPIQMAIAPKLIIFSVMSNRFSTSITAITQTGMDREMVRVAPQRRRNRNTTTADSRTPARMFWNAVDTVSRM